MTPRTLFPYACTAGHPSLVCKRGARATDHPRSRRVKETCTHRSTFYESHSVMGVRVRRAVTCGRTNVCWRLRVGKLCVCVCVCPCARPRSCACSLPYCLQCALQGMPSGAHYIDLYGAGRRPRLIQRACIGNTMALRDCQYCIHPFES